MERQLPPYVPVTFETGRRYKVHSSYIWLGPLVATLMVIVVGGLNGVQGIIQAVIAMRKAGVQPNVLVGVLIGIAAIAAIYGIVVGVYALSYRNMSFAFDELEFSFYSGIFVKRRMHLPYARVQSVNHRAGLFQRLAGVCTVTMDSAGGASNRALRVPYLRLETAERLRADVFARKAAIEMGVQVVYDPAGDPQSQLGAQAEEARARRQESVAPMSPDMLARQNAAALGQLNALDGAADAVGEWRGAFGGAAVGFEPAAFELRLSNRELLFTSISHSGPIVAAAVVVFSVLVSLLPIASFDADASALVSALLGPAAAASGVAAWVIGAAGTAISYGGFKCRRRGTRIETESGLLQRSFAGVDIERVQFVEVRQSLVRKLIGYCEITIGLVKASEEDGGGKSRSTTSRGMVIHPFVKADQVEQILVGLLPEFADRPTAAQLYAMPPRAMRRAVLRRCVWFNAGLYVALALVALLVVLAWGPQLVAPASLRVLRTTLFVGLLACIAYSIGRAVGAVKWVCESGFVWNRGYLLLKNGGWSSSAILVPRGKIQSGSTRDNPFQRRVGLTSIIAITAAGTSNTSARIIDVPDNAGADYLAWLEPRRQ